jgi:hypothetical protein
MNGRNGFGLEPKAIEKKVVERHKHTRLSPLIIHILYICLYYIYCFDYGTVYRE